MEPVEQNKNTAIQTPNAPHAIGPYSQAICRGAVVYLSGQIPLDPTTMTKVTGGFDQEAIQVFENLKAVAIAAGGSLNSIVKLTIYLTDLSLFSRLNQIMEEYFSPPYPARATIQVSALPKEASIEIDGIMVL